MFCPQRQNSSLTRLHWRQRLYCKNSMEWSYSLAALSFYCDRAVGLILTLRNIKHFCLCRYLGVLYIDFTLIFFLWKTNRERTDVVGYRDYFHFLLKSKESSEIFWFHLICCLFHCSVSHRHFEPDYFLQTPPTASDSAHSLRAHNNTNNRVGLSFLFVLASIIISSDQNTDRAAPDLHPTPTRCLPSLETGF